MIADIFMNHVLDKALEQSHESNKPITLFHFVDDLFLLFPNEESAQQFFKTVNSIHESIKITLEQESNGKIGFS